MSVVKVDGQPRSHLCDRYRRVREFTELLCETLTPEDCVIQSMPDVSPTRWHMAHTTWFFETFLLADRADYQLYDPAYAYLFNSYYNTLGEQFPRDRRGQLSRPGLEEVRDWRRHVDRRVLSLLEDDSDIDVRVLEIGLHHEQQHHELMLTDIKHVFSINPLLPVYRAGTFRSESPLPLRKSTYDAGLTELGAAADGFTFDNERPRHRVWLEAYDLSERVITCGEYMAFIQDGGYLHPDHWLSLGWQTCCDEKWTAPLYWFDRDGEWWEFTLAGPRPIDQDAPVTHVSYFEADAFARWAGSRLPTEAEWEHAAAQVHSGGDFVDTLLSAGHAIHPHRNCEPGGNMFGGVWEWTSSPYVAYPGYAAPSGALGEYNGKFMCNQFVLRGGSCATSSDHIRPTYRNFFPPAARWQFTGIRLC